MDVVFFAFDLVTKAEDNKKINSGKKYTIFSLIRVTMDIVAGMWLLADVNTPRGYARFRKH